MTTKAETLKRDIHAAIAELAAGAQYPDLIAAVDELAALAPEIPSPPGADAPAAWQERQEVLPGVFGEWYETKPRHLDWPREIDSGGIRYQFRPLYAVQAPVPADGDERLHPGLVRALAERRFRGATDAADLYAMAANVIREDGQVLAGQRAIIDKLKASASQAPAPAQRVPSGFKLAPKRPSENALAGARHAYRNATVYDVLDVWNRIWEDLPTVQAPAVQDGMVLVPRDFVQGFGVLAHNYSMKAEAPDFYQGVERDAFANAYRRCGEDLARLRNMLEVDSKPPVQPMGDANG